jgi:hypothetical protein
MLFLSWWSRGPSDATVDNEPGRPMQEMTEDSIDIDFGPVYYTFVYITSVEIRFVQEVVRICSCPFGAIR